MAGRTSPARLISAGLVWFRILSELRLLLNCLEWSGSEPAVARFRCDGSFLLRIFEHLAVLFAIGIDQRAAFSLCERQLTGLFIKVDDDEVAGLHLLRRHEIRNRVNKEALDRTLQVPRAVFEINSLVQQKRLRLFGAPEDE